MLAVSPSCQLCWASRIWGWTSPRSPSVWQWGGVTVSISPAQTGGGQSNGSFAQAGSGVLLAKIEADEIIKVNNSPG